MLEQALTSLIYTVRDLLIGGAIVAAVIVLSVIITGDR